MVVYKYLLNKIISFSGEDINAYTIFFYKIIDINKTVLTIRNLKMIQKYNQWVPSDEFGDEILKCNITVKKREQCVDIQHGCKHFDICDPLELKLNIATDKRPGWIYQKIMYQGNLIDNCYGLAYFNRLIHGNS